MPDEISPDEIVLEADGTDEASDFALSSSKREILTKSGDPQITALHAKEKRGRLVLQPRLSTPVCVG
jgi:hypothetical protein